MTVVMTGLYMFYMRNIIFMKKVVKIMSSEFLGRMSEKSVSRSVGMCVLSA